MSLKFFDKKQLSRWQLWCLLIMLPCVYAVSILFVVYSNVWQSGLQGGSNGQADAYRHSLASALVAHTTSPKVVDLVTLIMERDWQSDPFRAMDRHNNKLGARIGASVPLSLHSIDIVNQKISYAVTHGAINTNDPNQICFMAKKYWTDNRYY